MKTKQLLLTAAIAVVGTAASMAQTVYSVNVVGYVNVTLKPGFNLIANPLNGTNNTIQSLFTDLPDLTQLYKFNNGYQVYTFYNIDANTKVWDPDGNATMNPGEGAFIFNPTASDYTVTFVGEVLQGNLTNNLPTGFSIRSSQVPQAGSADTLGLAVNDLDQLYQWKAGTGAGSGWTVYTYYVVDANTKIWDPQTPNFNVGESFFLSKTAPGTWVRSFTVQ